MVFFTSLRADLESKYSTIPLSSTKGQDNSSFLNIRHQSDESSTSEIVFTYGSLLMTDSSGKTMTRLPFRNKFWLQYSLQTISTGSFDTSKPNSFLNTVFSAASGTSFNSFNLSTRAEISQTGIPFLRFRVKPFKERNNAFKEFTGELSSATENRIEMLYDFTFEDSVKLEFHINNRQVGAASFPFVDSKEFIELQFSKTGKQLSLLLANFIISDKRKMTSPSKAANLTIDTTLPAVPVLMCSIPKSVYEGESYKAAEWQLNRIGINKPIFNEVTEDPTLFNRIKFPFMLDSGAYIWKVRLKNNFDNWGHWSTGHTFTISTNKVDFFEPDSVFVTISGTDKQVSEISPEKWYQLQIHLNKGADKWNNFGYLIASISHESFTYGHPGNKGGRFFADKNYVFNIDLDLRSGKPEIRYYEKKNENSLLSETIQKGRSGLYFDTDSNFTFIDTSASIISLRFKLLNNAVAGNWIISTYTSGTNALYDKTKMETMSNIYSKNITVVNNSNAEYSRWIVIVFVLVAAIIITGSFVVNKRKKKISIPDKAAKRLSYDYERIISYLKDNIRNESLNVNTIREVYKLPRDYIYEVIKSRTEESLPQIINSLRIQTAEEMLKDPTMNISEIGYAVGFSEPRYFSKIFKSLKNITPTEYREQVLKQSN